MDRQKHDRANDGGSARLLSDQEGLHDRMNQIGRPSSSDRSLPLLENG